MKNLKMLTTVFIMVVIMSMTASATNLKTSLQTKEHTFSFYEEYFSENNRNDPHGFFKAKQWVAKAKREKEYNQVIKGFRVLMFIDKKESLLAYSDSIVHFSRLSGDNKLIGNAYLTRGVMYYNQKELVKALDNYILADKYISQTSDPYMIHKLKYVIAQAKYYLGYYDETLSLINDCIDYFQFENEQAYLSSLHLLAICHTSMGNYELANERIKMGLIESEELEIPSMLIYYKQAQAVNNFYLKKYDIAISQLNHITQYFKNNNDDSNLMLSTFYIAKCYWKLEKKSQALQYLLQMDKYMTKGTYIKPEFRETYEMLFEYYNETKDLNLELKYNKKLRDFDAIISKKYAYLSRTIQKKYDTAQLIKAMSKSERKYQVAYVVSGIAILIIIILVYRNYKSKKYYLLKFNQLMQADNSGESAINKVNATIDISDLKPDFVEKTLKNLEKFEAEKKYLNENMNLTHLSKALQTNSKYASLIILKYRGKKTVEYISTLRVNYIMQILKTQPKYRRYTTAALAELAGFGSAQNLTRAFKNQTDFTPMHFINLLNQTEEV